VQEFSDALDLPGLVVLSDHESRATNDVWADQGVSEAADSVSVRLDTEWTPADPGDVQVEVTGDLPASDEGQVRWMGNLSVPSGVLVVSTWGLTALAQIRVQPGSYRAAVLLVSTQGPVRVRLQPPT